MKRNVSKGISISLRVLFIINMKHYLSVATKMSLFSSLFILPMNDMQNNFGNSPIECFDNYGWAIPTGALHKYYS